MIAGQKLHILWETGDKSLSSTRSLGLGRVVRPTVPTLVAQDVESHLTSPQAVIAEDVDMKPELRGEGGLLDLSVNLPHRVLRERHHGLLTNGTLNPACSVVSMNKKKLKVPPNLSSQVNIFLKSAKAVVIFYVQVRPAERKRRVHLQQRQQQIWITHSQK